MSYRHPALRESCLSTSAVYDESAIIDGKSTKNDWNHKKLFCLFSIEAGYLAIRHVYFSAEAGYFPISVRYCEIRVRYWLLEKRKRKKYEAGC